MNKHLKNQILNQHLTIKNDSILVRQYEPLGMGYIITSFVIGAYILSSVFFPKSITFGPTGMEYLFGLLGLIIIVVPLILKRGSSTFNLVNKTLIHKEGIFTFSDIRRLYLEDQKIFASVEGKDLLLIEASKRFPVNIVIQDLSLQTGIPFETALTKL